MTKDAVPAWQATADSFDFDACPLGADPFELLERQRRPTAFWSSDRGGYWVITRADDFRDVVHNHEIFKSLSPIGVEGQQALIPIFANPPIHTKYRQMLTPMFSPHAVAKWESFTREQARDRVNLLAEEGSCEFVDDFARALPLRVFGMFMGLDPDWVASIDPPRRGAASDATEDASGLPASMGTTMQMHAALQGIIDERLASPDDGDDIPRQLARATVDGRSLTRDEYFNLLLTMFIAGFDTTASALSMFHHFMARRPDVRPQIVADPTLTNPEIEEFLRLRSFVSGSRTAVADIELSGVSIKAGDQVLIPGYMASCDPSEVPDPLTFQINRSPNRHVAFGAGPHRCLGSHLARMVMRVGIEEWHAQIPDYELASGHVDDYHAGHVMGLNRLHLVWGSA